MVIVSVSIQFSGNAEKRACFIAATSHERHCVSNLGRRQWQWKSIECHANRYTSIDSYIKYMIISQHISHCRYRHLDATNGRGVARRRQRGPGLNFKILKIWKLPRRKLLWKMFGEEMLNWASTSKHTTLRPWTETAAVNQTLTKPIQQKFTQVYYVGWKTWCLGRVGVSSPHPW